MCSAVSRSVIWPVSMPIWPIWSAWRRKFPQADIERAFELLDIVGLSAFAHQRADAQPATPTPVGAGKRHV